MLTHQTESESGQARPTAQNGSTTQAPPLNTHSTMEWARRPRVVALPSPYSQREVPADRPVDASRRQ
eukprot:5817429-Pleurochrysis_carterae.AAC.1